MSVKTYDIGDLVRVTGVFTNSAGTEIDPSVVTFKVKDPANVTTTYIYGTDVELVKDSTGNYYVDIDVDDDGSWYYRFESTGTGQAAAEGRFVVNTSYF
jgi:hypothetical protein